MCFRISIRQLLVCGGDCRAVGSYHRLDDDAVFFIAMAALLQMMNSPSAFARQIAKASERNASLGQET